MIGQLLDRVAPWLLIVLAALACPATAGTDYTLSARPVWDGHVKPGVPSEVQVRMLASRGGQARLTLQASRSTVHSDAMLEAGIPREKHLPLSHDTALPVTVGLTVDGVTVQRESLPLHVLPADRRVVAVVDSGANMDWKTGVVPAAETTVIHARGQELPRTGRAYKLLTALFMAESALREMSNTQRQALAAYAAGCGRLYLSGASSSEAQALLDVAGCSASNVVITPSPKDGFVSTNVVEPLAAGTTLGTLLPESGNTVLRSIIVLLLGYACVLLFGARSAKSALSLLLLPPAATLLAVLAWYLASPRVQVAGLAEMDSGDPMARFAAMVQVTGTAPGEVVLALPAQLGLPSAPQPHLVTRAEIDTSARRLDLHLDARLMSRHTFRVEGIAGGTALTVASNANGVRVTNRGDNPSAAAILAWQGQRYTVPGLAAGQAWSQPDKSETWGRTAQEQILRQRATDGGSWLLLPHEIPALRHLTGATDSAAWLLVRGAADA